MTSPRSSRFAHEAQDFCVVLLGRSVVVVLIVVSFVVLLGRSVVVVLIVVSIVVTVVFVASALRRIGASASQRASTLSRL